MVSKWERSLKYFADKKENSSFKRQIKNIFLILKIRFHGE